MRIYILLFLLRWQAWSGTLGLETDKDIAGLRSGLMSLLKRYQKLLLCDVTVKQRKKYSDLQPRKLPKRWNDIEE